MQMFTAPATMAEVAQYQHPAVVRRFQKDHPEKADRAQQIFQDLMLFFWASKHHELARKQAPESADLDFFFIMDEEMREIDQMWHVFLLYTQDYMDYCQRYFGEYLHHLPDVVPTFNPGTFDFTANLERFLAYSYDLLGEEVVRRWFATSLEGEAA